MLKDFWEPTEPIRALRAIHYLYGGLSVILALAVVAYEPDVRWLWALVLGLLAWGALTQGLPILSGIVSLELALYLFAFLCASLPTAFITILVCTLLSILSALATDPSARRLGFVARKLGNTFVLGSALYAAAWAYDLAGGPGSPHRVTLLFVLALGSFWLLFALVNHLLIIPILLLKEGRSALPDIIKLLGIDALLHGISVFAGAGFALAFVWQGWGIILLLGPVFALLVVFLKRTTDQQAFLRQQRQLLSDLNALTQDLHQSLSLTHVLDVVEAGCRSLFGVDTYYVALFDERTSSVQIARAKDAGTPLHLQDMNLDEGLTGTVIRSGKPLFIQDLLREPELRRRVKSAGDRRKAARAVMMAPLADQERVVGVISVQSHQPGAFETFHEEIFLSWAQHVSTAVVAARLLRRATEDALTRLFNKSYFEQSVASCLKEGEPFGLLIVDCDDFKKVNDRFGHLVGDRYLERLGEVIQRQCRAADVPCRYGGDEFAILMSGASEEQTRYVAERLRSAIEKLTIEVDSEAVGTTASIGILWSDGGVPDRPIEDILRRVDERLYAAKQTKNAISY